jgi:glycyl-tRNA synthetase beta chain
MEMTQMKRPINEFFDEVMVMVDDEAIQNNRLALLDEIGKLFLRIADFSKLT